MLAYFAERPEIETIGIYLEGFKDLDGLDFAQAVRQAVLNGKEVVVYKAGRTAPGIGGVMGHTASIAGESGAVRVRGAPCRRDRRGRPRPRSTISSTSRARCTGKKIGGNRLGAISGAGFEAVGMADSIASGDVRDGDGRARTRIPCSASRRSWSPSGWTRWWRSATRSTSIRAPTTRRICRSPKPFCRIRASTRSSSALDPTAPAVRALEESKIRPGFDISDPKSTVHLMPPLVERNEKPIVGIVDGGRLYDAMCAGLMDQGVCVFRNCARGTRALVRYIEARLYADALRKRAEGSPSEPV